MGRVLWPLKLEMSRVNRDTWQHYFRRTHLLCKMLNVRDDLLLTRNCAYKKQYNNFQNRIILEISMSYAVNYYKLPRWLYECVNSFLICNYQIIIFQPYWLQIIYIEVGDKIVFYFQLLTWIHFHLVRNKTFFRP